MPHSPGRISGVGSHSPQSSTGPQVTPTAPGLPPTPPARPQPGWTKVRPRSSRESRITEDGGWPGLSSSLQAPRPVCRKAAAAFCRAGHPQSETRLRPEGRGEPRPAPAPARSSLPAQLSSSRAETHAHPLLRGAQGAVPCPRGGGVGGCGVAGVSAAALTCCRLQRGGVCGGTSVLPHS